MTHEDATRLFYEHVWPHRAMVLRTARFLSRNDAQADDLAQETLVKAFKSISQFEVSSSAKSWLSAILRNNWVDRIRSSARHGGADVSLDALDVEVEQDVSGISADQTDAHDDPAALLEQFSDADVITALKTLPEEIRWTLMLVDVEQLDQSDAAQILGIPEGTVKSRAHRGRRMLRDHFIAEKNTPHHASRRFNPSSEGRS